MSTNDGRITSALDLVGMVPEGKKGVAEALAGEIEFMSVTLGQLKAHITEHGAVQWYVNGKQEMWRESPAMKSYSSLIPRFAALYKQLVGLLPDDDTNASDELDTWLAEN